MKRLNFLRENLDLKIISLILGILVWFNATTDEISVYTIPFKVSYSLQGLGDTLVFISELPEFVYASIKTSGKTFLRIKFSEKVVHKNLSNLRYGVNEVRFDYEDLPLSLKDIEIFNITPRTVLVQVDRIQKRKLPVKAVSISLQNEALYVKSVNIAPESTTLIGPASIVSKIQFLPLEPIKVRKYNDTLFWAKLENFKSNYLKIENQGDYTVKITLDTLYQDSIWLRGKKFDQKIKVTFLRPSNYQVTSKIFSVKTIPIDSTENLTFYKIEVDVPYPIKIKSVEPEVLPLKRSN